VPLDDRGIAAALHDPFGGVLALDLASTVGWAYGQLGDRPRFGTWKLPHIGGEGCRYAAFENELIAAMALHRPSHLILEAPLSFAALLGVSNARVVQQQYTLRGIAFSEAYRGYCSVSEVSSDMVRGELMGQSRFAKDTVKREVVRFCWRHGFKVPDHNAGDAVMVWLWHRGRMRSNGNGPLFIERAA
jgi:hypothetical protein